jgi:hypothetical protein
MFSKFITAFSNRHDTNLYAHLPEKIQAEIKSAYEATTIYDIR